MKRMHLLISFFFAIILAFSFIGCEEIQPTADQKQAVATKQSMAEADRQIGMPNIVNFQERKLAKAIFELRDSETLITYAYIVNLEGDLIFLGKCLGYGLPYSVQYTNPERIALKSSTYGSITLPQPDPNGLFMPDGLSATWLMMVDPKSNTPRPIYVEPQIIVSPFPLH